jgi:hypothetical protein
MRDKRKDQLELMQQLAQRVHDRRDQWERRHPGRRIPITDSISRILEHDPTYKPPRRRALDRVRPPLTDPRISTLRLIAADLETTVGDLLGETPAPAMRPVDVLSHAQRRTLNEAAAILRLLLDLEDPALQPAQKRMRRPRRK